MPTSFVKYVGPSHIRAISADEWKAAGFPNGESVVWDWTNAFSIPADKFTPDQLRDVIEVDGADFVIVSGDEHAPRKLAKMTGEQHMLGKTIGTSLGGQVVKTAPADAGAK